MILLKWSIVMSSFCCVSAHSLHVVTRQAGSLASGCKSDIHNGTIRINCNGQGLSNIPSGFDRSKVVELLFDDNRLGPKISNQTFANFTILQKLTLERNFISSMENRTLHHLNVLEYLSLFENSIDKFPKDIFKHQKKLKYLNISGNKLQDFPDYTFKYLESLEVLLMQGISSTVLKITKLGPPFGAPKGLKNLTMTAFSIPNIGQDFFDNLQDKSAMLHVDLAADEILTIHPRAFRNFTGLLNLTLNLNSHLNDSSFENALMSLNESYNLTEVACFYCDSLAALTNRTFSCISNSKLRSLYLSYSSIETAEVNTFLPLNQLECLGFDNTRIKSFNDGVFNGLQDSLVLLDISDNEYLLEVHTSLANLSQLQMLDMSGNPSLGKLDAYALRGLEQVTKAYMYNCGFQQIHNDTFIDMGKTTMLDISQNVQLSSLGPTAMFGLWSVAVLYIDDTLIEELDGAQFQQMPLLKSLSAASMRLADLPEELFENNTELTHIILTDNRIEYVNLTFQNMHYLQKMLLDENRISNFSEVAFVNCTSLHHLDISQQTTNGTLHTGQLDHIPKTIIHNLTDVLQYLDISYNNITYFNATELAYFKFNKVLDTLNAAGNPYNCSCFPNKEFEHFLRWFNRTDNTKIDYRTRDLYTCGYPKAQKGHRISQFNLKICIIPPDYFWVYLGVPLGLIFLISVFSAWAYYKRWTLRYIWFKIKRLLTVLESEDIAMLKPYYEYDAYISHGHSDSHVIVDEDRMDYRFIKEEMLPHLCQDRSNRPFRFSADFMTFLSGHDHSTQILEYMNVSRKVIILLTKNYLNSPYGIHELENAYDRQAAPGVDNFVILALIDEIKDIDVGMPQPLKTQLKRKKYIEWTKDPVGQKLFWEKLREALVKPTVPNYD